MKVILLDMRDCKSNNYEPEFKSTGRMPDFLIIGAMKSGSTSLFTLLGGHPQIFLPRWKELQYFSRDYRFNLGEKWYRDHFADAGKDQLLGEASTCYTRWPHYPDAAERIAERLPNVRLIYLMRHPVERAYSHYGHIMQERMTGKIGSILTFEETLEEEKEIIDASLYMMQIERYLPLFGREQMLFLTLDELKSSPLDLLQRVQEFLGVNPIDLTALKEGKVNQWGDSVIWMRMSQFFQGIKRVPGLSTVLHVLPKDVRMNLRDAVFESKKLKFLFKARLKEKKKMLSPLTTQTRKRLLRQFEEPTKRLEEYLGLKLVEWYK